MADKSTEGVLQPAEISIRPKIGEKSARKLVEALYGVTVIRISELNSYDDRNFLVKIEATHANRHLGSVCALEYVLKILNSFDSRKQHTDAEHEAMRVLGEQGFNCPQPVLNIHGQDKSIEKIYYDSTEADATRCSDGTSGLHVVRLLTFVPGKILRDVSYTPALLRRVGQFIGQFESALENFKHPALDAHDTIWTLDNIPRLTDFIYVIKNAEDQLLVQEVVKAFTEEVLSKRNQLQSGAIHGDYNEQNIIVQLTPPDGAMDDSPAYDVYGVIDFGDLMSACYVYEVAIAIMYMMLDSVDVDTLAVGGHVLAGYLSVRKLNELELDCLKVCVAARYAQSLTLGAYSHSLDPKNTYLLQTAKNGWAQLRRMWNMPRRELYGGWKKVLMQYNVDVAWTF